MSSVQKVTNSPVTPPLPDTYMDPVAEELLRARREFYRYSWKTPLLWTPCKLQYFLESLFCPCCAAYYQRQRALFHDKRRYLCCYGACPLSGRLLEQRHPNCCLCLEVLLCVGLATMTTRWIIQDQMRLGNGGVDNCLTSTIVCARTCLNSIICNPRPSTGSQGSLDRQAALRFLECAIIGVLAGPLVCLLYSCLLSQQYEMLNMRDKNPNTMFEPYDAATAPPPIQRMDRMPQKPTKSEAWWGIATPDRKLPPPTDVPEHLSAKANPPHLIAAPPRGWPSTQRMKNASPFARGEAERDDK